MTGKITSNYFPQSLASNNAFRVAELSRQATCVFVTEVPLLPPLKIFLQNNGVGNV